MARVACEQLIATLAGQENLESVVRRLARDGAGEVVRRVGEQGASAGGQTASERIYGEISKDR